MTLSQQHWTVADRIFSWVILILGTVLIGSGLRMLGTVVNDSLSISQHASKLRGDIIIQQASEAYALAVTQSKADNIPDDPSSPPTSTAPIPR